MTSSEFSFLALGLVLGVVSGAALVELLRARPPARHEVKVTVAPDAVPRRRPATLADDAFVLTGSHPARGGPADRRLVDADQPAGYPDRRTSVRFSRAIGATIAKPGGGVVGIPVGGAAAVPVGPGSDVPRPGRIMEPAVPLTAPPTDRTTGRSAGPEAAFVAVPVAGGEDPILAAITRVAPAAMVAGSIAAVTNGHADADDLTQDRATEQAELDEPRRTAPTAVGLLERPVARTDDAPAASSDDGPAGAAEDPAAAATPTPVATGPCAEERRLAEERCEVATRARVGADTAADALRAARRAYDNHESLATAALQESDPRAIQAAKESAQSGFRAAVAAATNPDGLEGAARDWLTEINRINTEARDAAATAKREQEAAWAIASSLEQTALEADAARIAAESAELACLTARSAVADCDERSAEDPGGYLLAPSGPASSLATRLDDDETLGNALEAGGVPKIFLLLRGDRPAMTGLVATLAGDDPEDRRRWQLRLTSLIESILADAIEASALDFPDEHPFWGVFERDQRRDVVRALASLGYRFDGLGGWTDGRMPTKRDLSLALGYAGQDPMRIRQWPDEETTAELFAEATVTADEYLAGVAGDLTLAEMVTMLGRRADGLAELWNDWGRIRPLLLEEA